MLVRHIDFRIRGFYKMTFLSNQWEAMMRTRAQQKLDVLVCWNKHGLNAARDVF